MTEIALMRCDPQVACTVVGVSDKQEGDATTPEATIVGASCATLGYVWRVASNYLFFAFCNAKGSLRIRHDGLLESILVANQPTSVFRRGRGGAAALTRLATQGILPVRPGLIPSGTVPKKAAGVPNVGGFFRS